MCGSPMWIPRASRCHFLHSEPRSRTSSILCSSCRPRSHSLARRAQVEMIGKLRGKVSRSALLYSRSCRYRSPYFTRAQGSSLRMASEAIRGLLRSLRLSRWCILFGIECCARRCSQCCLGLSGSSQCAVRFKFSSNIRRRSPTLSKHVSIFSPRVDGFRTPALH